MIPVPGRAAMPLQYAMEIRKSGMPTGARAVCWALATFAKNETGKAWPGLKALSEATGLTPDTISKHTRLAEEKGYLHKERRFNGSILYTITIPIREDMVTDVDSDSFPDLATSGEGFGDLYGNYDPMAE